MPADAPATLGARASAGMVLTPKEEKIRLEYQKRWFDSHIYNEYG